MNFYSDDFTVGDRLPDIHAYAKENRSPSLRWQDAPEGTSEFAVICDDPDAPGMTWVHWVIYGIPAGTQSMGAGVPKDQELKICPGARQGINDFGNIGYDGPHPPPGAPHRYFFRIYALSEPLNLDPGATAGQLRDAMSGKILAQGEIVGLYSR